MSRITVNISGNLSDSVEAIIAQIRHEMERRAYLAANELRNASLDVLRGQRSGRIYRVPGTKRKYTASAPGEPPAVRTGAFRLSWQPNTRIDGNLYLSSVESRQKVGKRQYLLGELLEDGTDRMEPRPYRDRVLAKAEDKITEIYSRNYF